jgi:hypothetical protein
MDRRGRRARPLSRIRTAAGLALALAASTALASDRPNPLRAMAWLAPGADLAAALGREPAECLTTPADPALARSVEIGRAAFRDPLLLGGQAARAGLSCESCHAGGRDNPRFRFLGLSGAPGTADVTSSLFSRVRGNAVFDPKPIPDLAGPRTVLKTPTEALPAFIRGLVVEEFDGAEPPAAVLTGLADYVAALDPAACPAARDAPVTLASHLADARRALAAAATAPDAQTAARMIGAARAALFRIDERYQALPAETGALRAAAARLSALQAAARAGAPGFARDIDTWITDSRRLERRLAARQAESLYAPARLSGLQPTRP